jgi:hypothetical protein
MSVGADMTVWRLVAVALATSAAPACAQWTLCGTGLVSIMKHRVDAGYGVEPSSGMVGGSEVTVGAGDRFTVHLLAQAGSLKAQTPGAITRDIAEVAARLDAVTLHWLTVQVGAGHRTYSTLLARQAWTIISVGAEARLAFSESGVSGIVRGGILPGVWVNGLDRPDLAFAGAAGMEYRPGHAIVALVYALERYRFPAGAGAERREQTAALTLKVGWSLH